MEVMVGSLLYLCSMFQGFDASKITIPVVGGHSGVTIVPLLSQAIPPIDLNYVSSIQLIHCKNVMCEIIEKLNLLL